MVLFVLLMTHLRNLGSGIFTYILKAKKCHVPKGFFHKYKAGYEMIEKKQISRLQPLVRGHINFLKHQPPITLNLQ